MSKLRMKARAGVTLVELLVVMLIAVILAVSLLPMFKEYICKAQYNAEAVPVIATLRTKISLYQYEHNTLPPNPEQSSASSYNVSSWEFDTSDKEKFVIAYYPMSQAPVVVENSSDSTKLDSTGKTPLVDANGEYSGTVKTALHLGYASMLDIGYQDLRGKKSRPIDYVYYNIPIYDSNSKVSSTDSAYLIGCFGAGHGGLAEGTGYAVCEINLVSEGKKYIGTFERYKAKEKDKTAGGATTSCPFLYLSSADAKVSGDFVYCPSELQASEIQKSQTSDLPKIITNMELAGWKFTN